MVYSRRFFRSFLISASLKQAGLAVLTFLLLHSCWGQAFSGAEDLSLHYAWEQQPDGWNYPVQVFIPSSTPPDEGFPVGVVLHGNGGNGLGMLNFVESIIPGHIVIAPTGYLNSWNLCGESSDAPDVEMLFDLISQLLAFDNVDDSHIRLVGLSNGAGLVNQAFIELALPSIDAFVSIVTQMSLAQHHQEAFHRPSGMSNPALAFCGYDQAISPALGKKYLSICNSNDPVVPYFGGAAVGSVFLPAEMVIHRIAMQQGHLGPPASIEDVEGSDLVAFSYLEGDVVLVRGESGHGVNPAQVQFAAEFLSFSDGPSSEGESCLEDLDSDLVVSIADVLLLLGDFGCSSSCQFDVNGDDAITISDVLQMIAVFGLSCG